MDLRDLSKIYTADGPFVTAYLSVRRDVEDAAERYEVQWKDLLRELDSLGVDAVTQQAISDARGDHTTGGTRVWVASHGHVHLDVNLPEPLPESVPELVRFAPLPHLLPLIEMLSPRLPHLVVLVDRVGADVLAYEGGPAPVDVDTVEGVDFHIKKVRAGGWSMQHYQAHAEEHWDKNTANVAAVVEQLVRRVKARVVIVTGDVRAVQLLEKNLPAALQAQVRKVEGSRAADGGDEHIQDRIHAVLADEWRADTEALLATFAEEIGVAEKATNGLVDTVAALRLAQVETLIVSDALDGERPLWFGTDPAVIGVSRDETELSSDKPARAAADDVLVRSAVATDATIRVVPSSDPRAPREGVGAVLRFSFDTARGSRRTSG